MKMKKQIIPMLLAGAFAFGCTDNSAESSQHTHEDGTTHEDHAEPVQQEEFNVQQDTVHTHDGGEPHTH